MDAEQREPAEVASQEEPTVIFDPAKLTAQLSELLELYLARAKEALAEEQMSSKEAVACAKQVSGMLEDTQSGKLQKVDTSTEWPRLGFTVVAQTQMRVGRAHQPGSFSVQQPKTDNQEPLRSLEDAVKAVCQYDEETAILEPWALLLTRINKLTQRVAADVEAWKASCEESPSGGVGRADQPGSFPADVDECSTQVRRGTADAVPVQQQQPVQPLNRQDETSSCGPSSPSPTETPPNRGRVARLRSRGSDPRGATDSSPTPAGDWKLEAGSGFT
jgi:hypothetical protein